MYGIYFKLLNLRIIMFYFENHSYFLKKNLLRNKNDF